MSLNDNTENRRASAEPVYLHLVALGPGKSVKAKDTVDTPTGKADSGLREL